MSTWWLVLIRRSSSDSATTGLGNSGYQSWCPVAGQDQRLGGDGAIGDQVVEVVALGRGVLAHREVVDDQDQGPGVFTHALADGAIGVPTGEIGQHP